MTMISKPSKDDYSSEGSKQESADLPADGIDNFGQHQPAEEG